MPEPAMRPPTTLPTGRLLAVDDQGHGLRATWHLDRGFVNLTLWRDDACVESFHLTIEDAGRLTGFLVDGFAEVTASAVAADREPVPLPDPPAPRSWSARTRAALARWWPAPTRPPGTGSGTDPG